MGSDGEQPTTVKAATGGRSPLSVGQVVAGKYVIEAVLGTGGMGGVYAVRHQRTRHIWALKVLYPEISRRPEFLRRFLVEAEAAGRIGHPGIIEIIDQDRDGDLHFLVMPKLDGEELSARIARGHPLSAAFVARIGADLADAIAAAHRARIVHRDLKPANIFLARRGGHADVVQVLDFGIAKLTDDQSVADALTQSQQVYGTPQYMSPEQLRNARDVDQRTDVYAIGVVLHEALAGRAPFKGASFTDLVLRIMTEDPPPLETLRPDVPPALVAIIKRAMARDRTQRFSSAEELRDALIGCATDAPRVADVPANAQRRRTLAAVGAAVLVGVTALSWLMRGRPEPTPVAPPAAFSGPAPSVDTTADQPGSDAAGADAARSVDTPPLEAAPARSAGAPRKRRPSVAPSPDKGELPPLRPR